MSQWAGASPAAAARRTSPLAGAAGGAPASSGSARAGASRVGMWRCIGGRCGGGCTRCTQAGKEVREKKLFFFLRGAAVDGLGADGARRAAFGVYAELRQRGAQIRRERSLTANQGTRRRVREGEAEGVQALPAERGGGPADRFGCRGALALRAAVEPVAEERPAPVGEFCPDLVRPAWEPLAVHPPPSRI